MKFGIRPQAMVLTLVPLLSLVVLLGLGVVLAGETQEGAGISAHLADVLAQSEQLVETLSRSSRAVQEYSKSKRQADLAPIAVAQAQLPIQQRKLARSVAGDPQLSVRAAQFSRNVQRGMNVIASYANFLKTGNQAGARRLAAAPSTRQLGIDLERSQVAFDQTAQMQALNLHAQRRGRLSGLERLLVGCAVVGIVLTVAVSLLFGMRIVKRLRALGDNARRLADGVPAVAVTGNDEITELDRIYREMADRIQTSTRAHDEALAQLRRERDVAEVLQQTLLPEIPELRGLRIDTAYMTPVDGAKLGGDWFDVFALSERYVGLSVGDVTGHGLRAAATMGFVRQAIRIIARLEADPAAVMERVNRIVCEESGSIVTAFYGVFDRQAGALRYALAGHGPPIVVTLDGSSTLLVGEGMLLGLDPGVRFNGHEQQLTPGDGLVLYTDGVVEVERDYLKGMRDLEDAVRAEFAAPSANMAQGIQERVFHHTAPRDDSAVLVLAVDELIAHAETQPGAGWYFDARDQRAAHRVKRDLLRVLEADGLPADDVASAELVFGELLSNVVRHTPGPARVHLGIDDGRLILSVEDRGEPFPFESPALHAATVPDSDAEGGRGLFLISALCRSIAVEPTPGGKRTTVVLPLSARDAAKEHSTSQFVSRSR